MMTSYARLLGAPQFRAAETWHAPPLGKQGALLCYLACQGDWVSRDELLYVFYPDSAEKPARTNLRQLLTLTRRLPYTQGFEIEDTRVRFQIESDVAPFKKAVNEEKWPKVLELYQGELLHGFNPHELSEFDNWLSLERQTLHSSWRKASLTFAGELATTERYSVAVEVLTPLHKADPLDEEVMRAYLESLYHSNQKNQALETFATFKNTLHHELSSEPEASTLELITLIQQDKPLGARALSAAGSVAVKTRVTDHQKTPHTLPVQPTEFVGREREKTNLASLLDEKSCRLVTIVAPGGMGKTRLAIEVAKAQLEGFDKVCFVSFAAVASPDLMVYTLADALELSLFGAKPPKEQVFDYLKNKKMLLVLDNLEHLLSGIDLISDILATAPEIKILATSRERLQLQAEHIFDLEGLAVPDEHNNDEKKFDSLQLFAERARHNRLDFVLEQNLQAVTKICQLVGGMPLAIELAASWSRLLNPSEIVNELEGSLDLLSSQSRDLPERHHSMRMVFEASWQRLSDEEQTALRKLSVFQGGFTREAARAIAELDLPVLLSLVNKSFLWRDTTGRFSQHPLILQYLQEKATDYPDVKKQVEEKHGLYYLELVKALAPDLRTQKREEAREALGKELPNIRRAWDWTLREKRVEDIRHYARALTHFFLEYNHHEGAAMFKQAVAALDASNPEHHAALGYALIEQARHQSYSGFDTKANIEVTQRGLALLEPLGEFPGIVAGYIVIGSIMWSLGDFATAKEILTKDLSLARAYGSPTDIGFILTALASMERELGSFADVNTLMQTNLQELRQLGDLPNLSLGLALLGSYLIDNDKLDEGEKRLRESLELAQKNDTWVLFAQTDLARLAYKRRDFYQAETRIKEVYAKALEVDSEFFKATALAVWGRVKLAQGLLAEAEQLMVAGLRAGWVAKSLLTISHSLVWLAELSIAKGNVRQGVSWLSLLSVFPAIEKRDRDEALKIIDTARQQLSPRAFTQAQEASKALTLEGIVAGILEHGLESRPMTSKTR